jgi:hypothetical protein
LKVLLNPKAFVGKAYRLFTSNISLNELAQELSKVLQRPIRYREITRDQWIKESIDREGSANQEAKDHLITLWEGFLNLNQDQEFLARMSKGHDAFKKMTGESPTPLAEAQSNGHRRGWDLPIESQAVELRNYGQENA